MVYFLELFLTVQGVWWLFYAMFSYNELIIEHNSKLKCYMKERLDSQKCLCEVTFIYVLKGHRKLEPKKWCKLSLQQGRRSMLSFLKYYAASKNLKKRHRFESISEERSNTVKGVM